MPAVYEVRAERSRMSLAELRAFVNSLDGADGELTVIRAVVTFGGFLKSVKAEAVPTPPPRPSRGLLDDDADSAVTK